MLIWPYIFVDLVKIKPVCRKALSGSSSLPFPLFPGVALLCIVSTVVFLGPAKGKLSQTSEHWLKWDTATPGFG